MLPSDQRRVTERVKFAYCLLQKAFKKTNNSYRVLRGKTNKSN